MKSANVLRFSLRALVVLFLAFTSRQALAQYSSLGNFVLEPSYINGKSSISGKNCSLSREQSKTWLQSITCKNSGGAPVEFKWDGQNASTLIERRVSDAIRSRKLPFTTPDSYLKNGAAPAIVRASAGAVDVATVTAVCSILGYSEYVTSSDVHPLDGRCNYTSPADDFLWRFSGSVSLSGTSGSEQCSDGIDNDGDGLIDALVELAPTNGKTYTFAPSVDPGPQFASSISDMIRTKGFALTQPGVYNGKAGGIVRSDNANWTNGGSDNPIGTADTQTLTQVCKILGYRDYVSSSCRDTERSGRYPNGKCNFNSASDNYLWRFSGSDFRVEIADPKYSKTWITSITCVNQIAACSDGWDNDGDGKIDLADSGCASANDNDERAHDPVCINPTHPLEVSQCSDGLDNDSDGVSDKNDPGCWTNPTDPSTYNPNGGPESLATTQCQDVKDNDGDLAIDAKDPGCWTNPKDPSSYDRTRNNEAFATTECQDGLDNDGDGVSDRNDPGCWKDPSNPSTYDPTLNNEGAATTQCQDTKDNDGDTLVDRADPGCWTDPRNPATYDKTRNNEAAAGPSECSDGKDNDGDGVADQNDPGCWTNPTDPSTYNPNGGPESNATTQCQDNKDNDGDTLVDAKDPGCWTDSKNPLTYDKTRNSEAAAGPSECSDGKDNDGDGVADQNDPGCWTNPTDPSTYNPNGGPESSATTQCQDSKDNDSDVLIDAQDPGCWTNPKDPATYNRTRNSENAATTECQDSKDNDNDVVIDAKDPGCWTNPKDPNTYDRARNSEVSATTECQDGVDNDSDGVSDRNDPGCWKDPTNPATYDPSLNNEGAATTQCQDSKDNDSDTLVDRADPGCWTDPKNPATYDKTRNNEAAAGPSECNDGKDNDGDGVADKEDPGCWNNPTDPSTYNPNGGPESSATTQCQDSKDNDGDTLIDAKDPGCWTDPKNPATYDKTRNNEAAAGAGECSDGKDNDSDGVADKEDPGCWTNPLDPSTYDPNRGPESLSTTQCQDTKDNDADGLIDAKDPGCWKTAGDPATYDRTRNSESTSTTQCQDLIDNDNDNLIDMKDPGCKEPLDNDESDESGSFTVGIECVTDNVDGSRTAYFSYNNSSGADLSITTNTTEGTLNEFVTSGSKTAPPTAFKAGSAKGTVVATFSSTSLTWVVRAPKSSLSQAVANDLTPRCGKIVPSPECRGFKNGVMNVRFGYVNPNAFPLEFSKGPNNRFTAGASDRGQPSRFFAGKNSSVFEAPLATSDEVATWSVNGSAVSALTSLISCDGQCTDAPTSTITGNLDRIAADLSDVMNRAAELLASARGNLTRAQVQRNRRDAERSKKKAAAYQERANTLTIEFPAVVKTCPQAPPFCVSVNRGPTLDALRDLYANQRNSVQRTIARTYFRNTNKTTRKDSLVKQAKSLEAEGISELLKLPRVVVECK